MTEALQRSRENSSSSNITGQQQRPSSSDLETFEVINVNNDYQESSEHDYKEEQLTQQATAEAEIVVSTVVEDKNFNTNIFAF